MRYVTSIDYEIMSFSNVSSERGYNDRSYEDDSGDAGCEWLLRNCFVPHYISTC